METTLFAKCSWLTMPMLLVPTSTASAMQADARDVLSSLVGHDLTPVVSSAWS